MEKNKYYTPKIEDLFEGYEFEYREYDEFTDQYTDGWVKMRFDSRAGLGHDLTHQFNEGTVRVPYITREQIELEGWKIEDTLNDWFSAGFSGLDKNTYTLSYNIWPDVYGNCITIHDDRYFEHLYNGKCCTINDFRLILRILKIK